MNINTSQPHPSLSKPNRVTGKTAGAERQGILDSVKDLFSYTSRDADPHESFVGRIGKDMKHAAPFTAKLGAAGATLGLAAGIAVGSTVLLPVIGGVSGFVAATMIADKADNARNMKELAAIAGWRS